MARSFNGSTQYCEVITPAVTGPPCTLSCWIYATAVSRFQCAIAISRGTDPTANDQMRLMVYNTNVVEAASFLNTTATVATTTGTVTANTWHHIAATFSTSGGQFAWLNGTKSSSGGNSQSPSSLARTSIGRLYTTNAQFFPWQGRIAEAVVYNAVLDDAEIAALGDGYTPLEIRPQSIAVYYPLGGWYGQNDRDFWKSKVDLTPAGTPTWADHGRVIYPPLGIWIPSATVSSNDRTASITGTMGAMSASLSAGFTKPTYTASIAGTHAPMTAALSASRTLPTDTAAVTATNAAMSASLAATFATVQFSASIAATNAPMSAAVSATFDQPTYTESIAATLGPMTAALSATFAKPVDTASVAATLAPMTSMVSATSATEIDTASIIATLCAMTASLTAAFSDVIYVTTECGIVPHFTRSTVPRFRRRNIVASIRRNTVPKFRRARR